MVDIYKQAVWLKLKFKIGNSTVTVYDLPDFPTRSKDDRNLNTTYQNIWDQLQTAGRPSLDGKKPNTSILRLKYDIIRDVYQTKLANEARKKAQIAAKNAKSDVARKALKILNERTYDSMAKLTDAELLALASL